MHNYVRKNKLFTNTGSASIGLPKVGASASIKRLLAPIEADASTTFSTIIKVNVATKRTIKNAQIIPNFMCFMTSHSHQLGYAMVTMREKESGQREKL